MKVMGLDGRQYTLNLTGLQVLGDDTRPRSSYHLRCRSVLRAIYPVSPICEEVPLPGSGSRNLRLDFYLPQQRLAVEVHGEQHYAMKSVFHEDKGAYFAGVRRDADKRRWCESNNIRLIVCRYSDTDDEWRRQITDVGPED